MIEITTDFDLDCPRLASFLDENAKEYPDYYARLVLPAGQLFTCDIDGRLSR